MKPLSSRLLALNVLCTWNDSEAQISAVFDRIVSKNTIETRDLHLANAMILGVLRNQQYLDHILGSFAKHPLAKMKIRTLVTLRLGIFQLLLFDRVPESAAVNETVQAFKAVRQPKWLVNFVNGVLRNVARKKRTLPAPDQATVQGQPIYNHPDWMISRWKQHFGLEKTAAICKINNQTPALTLRVNTHKMNRNQFLALLTESDYQVHPGFFSPNALILPRARGAITELPGYEEGYFQVQDEAAQLAGHLLAPQAGKRYLDGCAGLGGKTSHLAAMASDTIMITAVEPDTRRYQLLMENLNRLGHTKVPTWHMTLEQFAGENTTRFDGILLDAPCSGTGVIRRQPDIRWNRKPGDLATYQTQQLQLLETASSLLTNTGVMVYATCSLEPEENEEVVAAFLARHPEFTCDDAREYLPEKAARLVDKDGFFRPTPADGLDGFFAARLRR